MLRFLVIFLIALVVSRIVVRLLSKKKQRKVQQTRPGERVTIDADYEVIDEQKSKGSESQGD